ncbi:UbiA family prenyltransferase [Candidatus Woesearchaeota archaeon]|nr:UbiA family prenyltransferase [Candidatus Woesearchaeota archaeon]
MRFLRLIKISRPVFYFAPIFVFLTGMKLAGDIVFSPLVILELIFFTLPYSLFLFGINDVFDYESDKLNPRKDSFLGGARLKKKELRTVYTLSMLGALPLLITSFFSMNFVHILACFLVLFVSYFYSAPPLRLKELPIIDSVSNALVIFFVVAMGFVLTKSFFLIPFKVYMALFFVASLHAMGAAADIRSDRKAKHKTIATQFGRVATVSFSIICTLTAFVLGRFSLIISAVLLLCLLSYVVALFKPGATKLMFYLACIISLIGGLVWILF